MEIKVGDDVREHDKTHAIFEDVIRYIKVEEGNEDIDVDWDGNFVNAICVGEFRFDDGRKEPLPIYIKRASYEFEKTMFEQIQEFTVRHGLDESSIPDVLAFVRKKFKTDEALSEQYELKDDKVVN